MISRYSRELIAKAKKFKGIINEPGRDIHFNKPIKIKNRADALDAIFLLSVYEDWLVSQDELLEALRVYIEDLPETAPENTKARKG